ncbi:hypothetical protein HDU93_001623 [Gonapodya sp. JEL0774]|nr:hypothetical protein HDU93_001623 [Gonapodya sp. JEL0774]
MDAAARLEELFLQQFELDVDAVVDGDPGGNRTGIKRIKSTKRKRDAEETTVETDANDGYARKSSKKRAATHEALDSAVTQSGELRSDRASRSAPTLDEHLTDDSDVSEDEDDVDEDGESLVSDDSENLMGDYEHADEESDVEDDGETEDDDGEEDSDEEADDSDSRGDSTKSARASKETLHQPAKQPVLVVADSDPALRARARGPDGRSKADWKAFMSSKVSKLTGADAAKKASKLTPQERQEDEDDRRNDATLADLIRDSGIIEEYTISNLPGRERRRYLQHRAASVGLTTNQPSHPLHIRLGIARAQKNRQSLAASAKRDGAVDTSHILGSLTSPLGSRVGSSGGTKRKRGVSRAFAEGGVGRIVGGVMRVTKEEVKRVEAGNSGGTGGQSSHLVSRVLVGRGGMGARGGKGKGKKGFASKGKRRAK